MKRALCLTVLLTVVAVSSAGVHAQAPDAAAAFDAALGSLREAAYAEKEAIVERLAGAGHQGTATVLTALLDNRLYYRNADGKVFVLESAIEDSGAPVSLVTLLDPASGRHAGTASPDALTRIGTNNALRKMLRGAIGRFALGSPDPDVRLAGVTQMLRSLDEGTATALRAHLSAETDTAVRRAMEIGLARADLAAADSPTKLRAIATLSQALSPEVRAELAALTDENTRNADGSFTEPDIAVRRAAAEAVRRIDQSRAFYGAIETMFFGLSLGSVLVLVAIGLAITFGVMGVINMAHGELMMLGAYTAYVVQLAMPDHIGTATLLAIPAALLVSGAAGAVLERTIIRSLYGRPLETLLATFGVSLVLQQLVRSVFSANNRAVATPAWMSGSVQVNGALALTLNRLYIVVFTAIVFAFLLFILKRTRFGLDVRAVAQNRGMARAMGVRSGRIDTMTFALGSGIAGVAGVALSQLTNVGPNLGQAYIIDAFIVVVFGGVGSLWGTLIGGLSMGVVDKLLEPYSGAVLAKIVVLVALILFIQQRPRGIFPPAGRAAESA